MNIFLNPITTAVFFKLGVARDFTVNFGFLEITMILEEK